MQDAGRDLIDDSRQRLALACDGLGFVLSRLESSGLEFVMFMTEQVFMGLSS